MYVLDIDVIRNGNNLKLKVKSEFSLSMGLMVINHSNPYIHSTTVLCDIIPCFAGAGFVVDICVDLEFSIFRRVGGQRERCFSAQVIVLRRKEHVSAKERYI